MAEKIKREEVERFLKEWVNAYESGADKFFGFYAKDASVFTISAPTRIDGAEEFKRGFGPILRKKVIRRSQILSPEIRIAGDQAVVTYHNRVSVDGQTTNMRATVVLQKDSRGALKIVHQHNSPLGGPAVVAPSVSPDAFTVLEERVATAVAAVGTPK